MKDKKCVCCGKIFSSWYKKRKYCSVTCFRKMPKTFTHMNLTKNDLRKLYFDDKLSFYKIEELKGIPVNSIRYWFKKWGLKARNLSEAQKGELNHGWKDGLDLKKRTLKRDNNKCTNCEYNLVLDAHHIIPVCGGGKDTLSNLITLCPNCHRLVHIGKLEVSL